MSVTIIYWCSKDGSERSSIDLSDPSAFKVFLVANASSFQRGSEDSSGAKLQDSSASHAQNYAHVGGGMLGAAAIRLMYYRLCTEVVCQKSVYAVVPLDTSIPISTLFMYNCESSRSLRRLRIGPLSKGFVNY